MKAFMVVCVPVCHIDFSPEKAVASPNPDSFQSSVSSGLGRAQGSLESPERDHATPPFWTWFIENPRVAAPDLDVINSRLKIEGG